MKILFLDTVHEILVQRLQANGWQCEYDYTSSYEEILQKISAYDGIVIRSRIPIDKRLLEKASRLKFIARSGSGLENIDVEYARGKNIHVISSPEGNRDAVAEHVLGMLLCLLNKICFNYEQIRKGQWNREAGRGIELKGKTFSIIGFGQMGSAVAERLQSFGCHILAYDKYKTQYAPPYVKETSLEEIFALTDILSIHLPLSKETHYYVNEKFIAQFKKPFYFINTARGSHVDTPALIRALDENKILGAALDVIEYESSSFDMRKQKEWPEDMRRLLTYPNVVLTPHVAGWTKESYLKLSLVLAEKIEHLFLNKPTGKS